MSKVKNSLAIVLPTVVTGALLFGVLSTKEENEGAKLDYTQVLKSSPSMKYVNAVDHIDTEFNRLKEEERKRIEAEQRRIEAERQARLKAIAEEKARQAEAERRRQAAIKAEQVKKRQQQQKAQQVQTISRGSEAPSGGNWMAFKGTYYGADCNGCSGRTATGIDVRSTIYSNGLRIIAVDPSIIKLGSIVEVKTPNETFRAIAGDTGGAIKGYKTDILVESEARASQIGTHTVYIRIIK